MAKKYLDYNGVLYFWQKIKALFVSDVTYDSTNKKIQKTKNGVASDVVTLSTVATSGSYNDLSNKPTIPEAVQKTTSTPLMDGTAAIGSEVKYAAGDHRHPTDTTRAPLASPAFTGTPTAPTATAATDNTQLATTAFVHDVVDALDTGVSDVQLNGSSVVNNGIASLTIDGSTIYAVAPGTGGDISDQSWVLNTILAHIYGDLYNKANRSLIGTASGICPLNSSAKIDSAYLPSYVDDVIEAYPVSGATALSAGWLSATSGGSALTPETGKIYVLMTDSGDYAANTQFRWGGTAYVKLADGGVSSITNAEIDTIMAA